MPTAPGPEPDVFKETHWTEERHGPTTDRCVGAFAEAPGLRSVAHFSNGILDFVVRRAEAAPLSSLVTVNGDEMLNEALPGSRLLLCAQDLNALLRPLGTGDLVRLVFGSGRGGLWGGRVKPGEFVAALTEVPGGVDPMDRAMNRTVTAIRTQVYHLPDEMLGGLSGSAAGEPADDETLRIDFGTAAGRESETEMRLRALWGANVGAHALQYLAYYRDWTLVCAGDVFEDRRLAPRFLDVSVRARRTGYRDFAQSLRGHLVRLNDALRLVTGTPADRLVLDVQEGALHVRWRSPREYVVGVTLDQTQVAASEQRLEQLVAALPEFSEPAPR
ncbi:hypothetical protein ACIQU5_27545 [Streptomyces sp. NPDC090306]|uniref:hypothetical protein n=1 Tax=unclassified Streptomyces TaxID=2593676 RepID=UPI0036F0F228